MHLKMYALKKIHSLICKIKSVTFFNWMVNGKLPQVREYNWIPKEWNKMEEDIPNKLLTFLSTMQQTALHFDHFWARCEWWKNWSAEKGCWNCCNNFHPQPIFHPFPKFPSPILFFIQCAIFIHCAIFHSLQDFSSLRDLSSNVRFSSITHSFIHSGWNCILGRIHLTAS